VNRPSPAPRRAPAGAFLSGAQGRLLPASLPFRYFGAAAAFHVAAWAALLAAVPDWARWDGGPGWPLAALHLATVGTLLTAAIGASLQLLPVATRQPVRATRAAAALWWLHVPGVATLAAGMGAARPAWMVAGAGAVIVSLAAWAVLLALNLRGARGMPGVVLHGRGALAGAAVLVATGAALVALWAGHPTLGRDALRDVHRTAGLFGTMGMLALGFAYVLLPMFALAPTPSERRQLASGGAAIAAAALAVAAGLGVAPAPLQAAALALGAAALAMHVRTLRATLAAGLRPGLGRPGALVRVGWASLGAALAVAAAHLAIRAGAVRADEAVADALGRAFVALAVAGWLLTLLFGVLQRILPFLASMHAARGRRRAPTPSALSAEAPLRLHAAAHAIAVPTLVAAAVTRSQGLAAIAGLAGLVAALAFAAFFATLARRTAAAARAGDESPRP
jgi:hypothetical protein